MVSWAGSRFGRARKAGFAVAAVAATLSACASVHGVLVPVAGTVPGASLVEMLVATTRERAGDPGEMFSGARGANVKFAEITVSIPPASVREVGEVQWPKSLPGNPATDFVTERTEVVDRAEAVTWFRQKLAKNKRRQVLVFIHGFNNRFEDAVYRFAQIVHDSDADVVPILFTWPSRGSVLAYGYDRESTNYSRDALEAVLRGIASQPSVGEISVLAHSMGNWLTLETLRQMAIRSGRVDPKIKNVLLAAPDVDIDIARQQIGGLGPNRPSFTLFVSQDDRALAVSRRVWGSTARLGAIDPEQEPYRTEIDMAKINVLDLTKLKSGDPLNHAKFAQSPQVVQLIGQRLAEQSTITDSRVGLADRIVQVTAGAAAVVGTAAGLVVSAPVAIIDPVSREKIGERVDQFNRTVTDTAVP